MSAPGHSAKGNASERTNVLLLGLYLIVLAFFIMLNAISHREDLRSKAVMGSVNSSFSAEPELVTGLIQATARYKSTPAEQQALDSVRRLFVSALPLAVYPASQPHDQITVLLPAEELFKPGTALPRMEMEAMLAQLAELVSANHSGKYFEIEIIPRSGEARLDGADLTLRRAGALVSDLRSRGVPAERLAAGVARGDSEQVMLSFFLRAPAESLPPEG